MKKILIALVVLLVLAGAGVVAGVWYLRSGVPFGIDKTHPLGQLEKVERYLVAIGLEKDEAALNSLSKTFLDRQVLYYVQPLPEGSEKAPDHVTVVADAEGRIQELTAELRNETSRIRLLCELYWNAAGGKTPDFSAADPEQEIAKDFTERSVQGTWSRANAGERVELRVR